MEALTMELRLRRIGNSLGVILPKEALEALGVKQKEGEKLVLSKLADGRGLELHHLDKKFEKKLALLRDTMKRYKNTLRALAK
jgi:putative addiction module antidote